jgi:tetratricopeptide (TPR) repeat protein
LGLPSTSAALAGLAQAAFALGDADQAASSARQLLGQAKLNANARHQTLRLLGDIERGREQFAAALDLYRQAVQVENIGGDQRILTLDRLVDMALTLKDYEAAVKCLQALKDTPGRYANRSQLDRYLDNVRRLAAPAERP